MLKLFAYLLTSAAMVGVFLLLSYCDGKVEQHTHEPGYWVAVLIAATIGNWRVDMEFHRED